MLVLFTMSPKYVQCIVVTMNGDLNIVNNIVIIVNIIKTNTIEMQLVQIMISSINHDMIYPTNHNTSFLCSSNDNAN